MFTDDAAVNGNCTLREAIAAADDDMPVDQCPAGSGPDTIVLLPGTYLLTDQIVGSLNISQDLTVTGAGPGVTVIDGAWTGTTYRVFHVIDKPDVVVTFSGLTIQDGSLAPGSGGGILADANTIVTLDRVAVSGNHGSNGGGIVNNGTMTISNSSITGNTSSSCCAGIFNESGATLTMTDSVIAGNTATGSDGGFLNYGTATLTGVTITGNTAGTGSGGISADGPMTTLTNVTISGNSVKEDGGGFVGYDPAVLNNVTITGNTANSDGDATGDGGGIYQEGPISPTVKNSIVAGNAVGAGGQGPDCFGTVTSGGHNMIRSTTGCTGLTGPGDLTGLDPLLGPLADNGGPTMTHALLKGSPAIDAGGTDCAATDQRSLPRNCDIGAYELVLCRKVPVNRIGTSGKDALTGTPGSDGILGFGGKDKLRGKGGNDGLCGGPGKDVLKGGGARDRLDGGPGKDLCVGQAGRDKATACEREKSIP